MKKSTLKNLIALAALAVMAGIAGKAQAQNNWTLVGSSPGGGYIIIGNSAPTDLGALGPATTPVFLSAHGSDIITLDAGNTATSSGSIVIDLEAPANLLNNYGTINDTSSSGYGVFAGSSGNTINNWGTISGEYAVALGGNSNIVNNWGMLTSNYTGAYIYGQNNVFNNQGIISTGDYALLLYGLGNTVNNWGTLTTPYDTVYEDGTSNTINNHGNITSTGSYGVYSDGLAFTLNNWGAVTVTAAGQQAVFADGGNFTLNNYNQINAAGNGVQLGGNNNIVNNFMNASIDSGSYGVYLTGNNNLVNNLGSIVTTNTGDTGIYVTGNNNLVNNQGVITGAVYGIDISGSSNIANNWGSVTGQDVGIENAGNNNIYNNWGTVYGGDEGFYLGEENNIVNNYGTIASANEAFFLNEPFNVINNWGTFSGGNYALYINDSNNIINNWGTFTIPSTGVNAVYFYTVYHNDTLNNWGMITSNSGPTAIQIDGANNTLNLNGHSSVIGKISVTGAGNVVNLNFTGVSATLLPGLNASLAAQGANTGTPTSVQFTLRQVNYNIDPAMVNAHLSSYQMQGLNLTEREVGAGLDSLTVNPLPGTPLFNLLNAIDASGNVPAALEALSPGSYAIYGDLAIANSTAIVQNIDARLNNLRDGSESIDTTGVGGTTDQTTAGFSKNDGKESKQIVAPPVERRWGFFATGDGLFLRGGASAGLQGAKSNNAGTLLGVDGKINENGVIGTFFSYDNADAKFDGSGASHATIESYTGGIYGAYHNDGFFANGLAAYTRNNYASARSLAFPGFINSLGGSTDGNQYTANLDGGYDWHLSDRVTMGPIAGLQYVHLDVDGFNETGGAGALAIGSQSMDSLQSRLGGRIDYHLHTGATSSVALDLHAAWQHEYLDDSRSISGAFGGGTALPISVQSGSPKRDAGVVGLGVNFSFHERLTLFADYELTMWSSSTFEQTINGGARISF